MLIPKLRDLGDSQDMGDICIHRPLIQAGERFRNHELTVLLKQRQEMVPSHNHMQAGGRGSAEGREGSCASQHLKGAK